MRRRKIEWKTLLGAFFMGAIALGLLGRALCTRSWKDYDRLRPECRIPDTIETVLYDESLDRLYVCYNDANRVNVYDGAGTFLWSVGTPWMRNSEFELLDRELVIFDGDAYRYDAVDGSFLGLAQEAELPVRHTSWTSQETRRVGPYAVDSFRVWREGAGGERVLLVDRPWWYVFFLSAHWIFLALLAALGIGLSLLLERRRTFRAAREEAPSGELPDPEARFLRNYYRATALVELAYALLCPLVVRSAVWILPGVLPLVLHFIISGWVLDNKKDRLVCPKAERAAVELWHGRRTAALLLDVLAVLIGTGIAS